MVHGVLQVVVSVHWSANLVSATMDGFICDMKRLDTGHADHRVLHMPASMWDAAGVNARSWAERLCCVYTWVERDDEASIPYMITYDGSMRTYEDSADFDIAAESVYSAVCGMFMGNVDCHTLGERCPQLNGIPHSHAFGGSGTWAPGVPEGVENSCNMSIQEHLRYGCTVMMETAQHICCHNTVYAEPRWYFEDAGGPGGLFAQLDDLGSTVFYDSTCGIPLYRAPVGRSFGEWEAESREHGWPSFRRAEAFMENMAIRENGEIESLCGTHLGHNLPDAAGDRHCIDLICIAGSPLVDSMQRSASKQPTIIQTAEFVAIGSSGFFPMAASLTLIFSGVVFGMVLYRRRLLGSSLSEPMLHVM